MVHVGIGYDVHQLVAGRKLVLGGVEIPHTKGLDGHSDADALMHAICDAVLGALPSRFGFDVMRGVIEAGVPYVDISFMPENALELDRRGRRHAALALRLGGRGRADDDQGNDQQRERRDHRPERDAPGVRHVRAAG